MQDPDSGPRCRNLVQDLDAGQPDPDAVNPDAACRGLLNCSGPPTRHSFGLRYTVGLLSDPSPMSGPRPSCLGPRLFVWGWSAEPRYS